MLRIPVLCSIMTIVHGKSERIVCENIRSNLKIKHVIDSEKKEVVVYKLMDYLKGSIRHHIKVEKNLSLIMMILIGVGLSYLL